MPTYLFDATSFNSHGRPFGIGRYAYYLTRGFLRIRDELRPNESLQAVVHLSGPCAVTSDLDLDHHATSSPMSYKEFNRGRARELPLTLARTEADLVHFVEGPQAITIPEKRVIVTCHDLIPITMPHHYLDGVLAQARRRWRDYRTYTEASRVIAISQCTADVLVNNLHLAPERVSVVLQGVDHERFTPTPVSGESELLRQLYSLPPRFTLYVGATDWRKRVELLIDSYRSVYRATQVPLLLVGADFNAPPRPVQQRIREAIDGSLIVLGEVRAEHLPALYRHADLHVLPSIYEGFGLTLLEAMASGCPVLTTRGGALHEVGGDAAWYVAPDSATELEDALVRILRDQDLRRRLRRLGLEQAQKFTWEQTARKTLATYRSVLGVTAPQETTSVPPHCFPHVDRASGGAPS